MRFKLIACEIFYRELCYAVAKSPHQVDVEFLPKGLHDIGSIRMVNELQQALDSVEENLAKKHYDAVLLGYGLCNNGLIGLKTGSVQVVVPRAHDCITLFLGSRKRYDDVFTSNPGTYYLTTGWIERGIEDGDLQQLSVQKILGIEQSYDEMVEQYGEENAKYLLEQLGDLTRHYSNMTFIEMGIEPDDRFEKEAQKRAHEKKWTFNKLQGNLSLFHRLVNSDWDVDFLVIPPNEEIAADYSEELITIKEMKS